MDYSDVYIVDDKLDLATDLEVTAAEQALGARLPMGYRKHVMTLGAGQVNDSIRIFPPSEIAAQTKAFRENEAYMVATLEKVGINRWSTFDAGLDLLPPERLSTAVLIGHANDSNRIVVPADEPDEVFLIDDTVIFAMGHSVDEAITWFLEEEPYGRKWQMLLASGQFAARSIRYFEPDRDRGRLTFDLKEEVAFEEVRAQLLSLGLQHPDGTLLVSEVYHDDEEDGVAHEILHFFVKAYGGAVWCSDVRAAHEGIVVQISYDRELQSESLLQLVGSFRGRAIRFNDHTGRVVVLQE